MKRQYPLEPHLVAHTYPAGSYSGSDDQVIDPKQALRALRRRLPLFLAVALATFLSVAVMTFQTVPTFTAGSTLIINIEDPGREAISDALAGRAPDAAAVETEVEVLRSRSLAEKVAERLNLAERPEFNPALQEPGLVSRLKGSVINTIRGLVSSPEEEAQQPTLSPEDQAERELQTVVSVLLSKTSVRRVGEGYTIAITARSHDPKLAAEIANTFADQYRVAQLDAKLDSSERLLEWGDERLESLRAEVFDKRALAEAYRASTGLMATGDSTITEQQVSDLYAQRAIQRAELAEAEARLREVRQLRDSGNVAAASAQALSSPVISSLRAQLADATRRRGDLIARYFETHPDVQSVDSEIRSLNQQIDTEIQRVVSNLEAEVSIAQNRVQSLETSINEMRGTLEQNNRARIQLEAYERDAENAQTLLQQWQGQLTEVDNAQGLNAPDSNILSLATVPTSASHPKTTLNLVIGVALGLMFGTLAVLVAESLNSQINSGEEIEEKFGVPFLGNVPKLSGEGRRRPHDHVIENPMSSFAESLRNLRASILFADLDTAVQTVSITSSQPDEGKTTLTFGLGRMSAMSGTKTLVIDGDFRRKQLTEATGVVPEAGFLECLFGEAQLDEAVIIDPKTSLHILPLTPDRHTPRDVFGSKAFSALMSQLKQVYELIIIDTGPLLLMAETRVLASMVDQVVVTARWQKTNRAALKQTLGILKDFRANIAGVLLNQVDLDKYHRHGYGHSGYKSYRKYYAKG